MRRLYESSAVDRDPEDQFKPGERDRSVEPQAMRSVPGNFLSRLLVPDDLRHRAISVNVRTEKSTYAEGTPIPFVIEMKNAYPIPVEVPTVSPVLWTWEVDGALEASRVQLRDPPEETRGFRFDRGERKQFQKTWDQRFRVADSEWEPAGPGTYTLGAKINVDDPVSSGLYGEKTITIER